MRRICRALTPEQIRASIEGQLEFWQFFEAEFADRTANPRDDPLTAVVQARVDDERPLDLEEMVSFASQMIGAGADTTSKLISSAAYTLATDPSPAAELRADRELVRCFLEESLRLEAPWRVELTFTTTADRVSPGT